MLHTLRYSMRTTLVTPQLQLQLPLLYTTPHYTNYITLQLQLHYETATTTLHYAALNTLH